MCECLFLLFVRFHFDMQILLTPVCSTLRLRVSLSLSPRLICEGSFQSSIELLYAWMIFHIARPDFIYVLRPTLVKHPTYSRRFHYIQMNKRKKKLITIYKTRVEYLCYHQNVHTHTHRERNIAHGHIEFAHKAMDIFGLYSMKMLFFSVESPVCELYCLSLFALTIFQVGKNGHSVQQAAIKWNY